MNILFRLVLVVFLLGLVQACKKEQTGPPTVITESATSITNTTVILNGSVNPNNLQTTITFEYGLTTSYGQSLSTIEPLPEGASKKNVSVDLTGLTSGLAYHFRLKAENEEGIVFGEDKSFTTTVIDEDVNTYNFITIGTQVWMKENLKTTKFKNGSVIPLVSDNSWDILTTPGYCWFNNDINTNKNTYGALYNWYAVNTKNLCPSGWHVPTDPEWTILTTYLGGEYYAGGKLKETGTLHWITPNSNATNETNFTSLPGGVRLGAFSFGAFSYRGYTGSWWADTEQSTNPLNALRINMSYNSSGVDRSIGSKKSGFSIRCIRD